MDFEPVKLELNVSAKVTVSVGPEEETLLPVPDKVHWLLETEDVEPNGTGEVELVPASLAR